LGANDGMMHAFRDGTYDPETGAIVNQGGVETFAYVPYALLGTLNQLADKTYVHRFYVDGPHVETDAYFGSGDSTTGWRNNRARHHRRGGRRAQRRRGQPRTARVRHRRHQPQPESHFDVRHQRAVGSQLEPDGLPGTGLRADRLAGRPDQGRSWVAIFGNVYESKSCQASLLSSTSRPGGCAEGTEDRRRRLQLRRPPRTGLAAFAIVRDSRGVILGAYAWRPAGQRSGSSASTTATGQLEGRLQAVRRRRHPADHGSAAAC
jgi:hypothetical protein